MTIIHFINVDDNTDTFNYQGSPDNQYDVNDGLYVGWELLPYSEDWRDTLNKIGKETVYSYHGCSRDIITRISEDTYAVKLNDDCFKE